MKNFCVPLSVFVPLALFVTNLSADLVVNFNNDIGPGATVADFQVADSALDSTADFFAINNEGTGAEIGFIDFRTGGSQGPLLSSGLSLSTVGAPANDGFAVPGTAHNSGDPILGSNLFDTGGGDPGEQLGIDVTGFSSLAPGSTVVLTAYGIGDNIGQQVQFDATFGTQSGTGLTRFNAVGEARGSDVGSVPFVQFTFTTDGSTDLLSLLNTVSPDADTDSGGGGGRTHINGVSISVTAVPEPSSTALIALVSFTMLLRRKRS